PDSARDVDAPKVVETMLQLDAKPLRAGVPGSSEEVLVHPEEVELLVGIPVQVPRRAVHGRERPTRRNERTRVVLHHAQDERLAERAAARAGKPVDVLGRAVDIRIAWKRSVEIGVAAVVPRQRVRHWPAASRWEAHAGPRHVVRTVAKYRVLRPACALDVVATRLTRMDGV